MISRLSLFVNKLRIGKQCENIETEHMMMYLFIVFTRKDIRFSSLIFETVLRPEKINYVCGVALS